MNSYMPGNGMPERNVVAQLELAGHGRVRTAQLLWANLTPWASYDVLPYSSYTHPSSRNRVSGPDGHMGLNTREVTPVRDELRNSDKSSYLSS